MAAWAAWAAWTCKPAYTPSVQTRRHPRQARGWRFALSTVHRMLRDGPRYHAANRAPAGPPKQSLTSAKLSREGGNSHRSSAGAAGHDRGGAELGSNAWATAWPEAGGQPERSGYAVMRVPTVRRPGRDVGGRVAPPCRRAASLRSPATSSPTMPSRNLGLRRRQRDRRPWRASACGPSIVSPIAFSALLYWLHDRPKDRFVISFLESEWSHEVVGGARRRHAQAVAAHRGPQRRPRRRFPPGAASAAPAVGDRARCGRCSASGPTAAASTTASVCIRCWRRRSTGASWWSEAKDGRPSSVIKDVGSGLRKPAQTLAVALDRAEGRGPAGLCLRQVGGRVLSRRAAQARARSRRRRRGDHLAAAAAQELPLPPAAGAVRRRRDVQPSS